MVNAPVNTTLNGKVTQVSCYLLTEDQIWCKVQVFTGDVLEGTPAERKHHQVHPRVLDEGHLVVDVKITES